MLPTMICGRAWSSAGVALVLRVYRHTTRCISTTGSVFNESTRLTVPLLGQNSTLVLRSKSKSLSQVEIIPQWRDDTILELVQDVVDASYKCDITAVPTKSLESSTNDIQRYGNMLLTFHKDGIKTSLGRRGSLVDVEVMDPNEDISSEKSNDAKWKLVATVPEKSNITCQIDYGDIYVDGKLEGDTHLSTSMNANITVGKLRGHNVTLDNTNEVGPAVTKQSFSDNNVESKGIICTKKAIEARTVQISASQRVRARMVNGSDIQIQVNPTIHDSVKVDEDDEGAIIDIGSLYISHGGDDSEAQLTVDATKLSGSGARTTSPHGIVRVKSNHGHVTINAKVHHKARSKDTVLVDLGGVNGSCDLLIEKIVSLDTSEHVAPQVENIASRIHFDAFAPESISTITSRGNVGDTSITIDRKVDAELRLLSLENSTIDLPCDLDAHSLSSDECKEVQTVLDNLNDLMSHRTSQHQLECISIETDAFESSSEMNVSSSSGVKYIQGRVENRSGEPDSRFDVQSRGKINKDGAALQALHGFQSKTETSTSANAPRDSSKILPLLSVATDGKIKLETLSWLGSIARRYGLEEDRNMKVGRQASRKPRLEK